MPKINTELRKMTTRITELELIILKSIDGYCEKEGYDVSYLEISTALSGVLKSNLSKELKESV